MITYSTGILPQGTLRWGGAHTYMNGGLTGGQDAAQSLQVVLLLSHREMELSQLLLLLFQGTEFLIYCSLQKEMVT